MASGQSSVDETKINQYINVTGADETIAKNMLEAFNGNLEQAINMFLEGGFHTETLSSSSSSNFPLHDNSDDVRAPIPQKQAVLVEDQYHAIPYLSRQSQRKENVGRTVFDSCRDFKKETEEYEKELQNGTFKNNKKKRLHELFRPPIDIMHRGDFQSARDVCISKYKWLLVNIQNSHEFACQVLNRDVWANKIVREIVAANFVLWQEHHDSDAGLHYGTFYQVKNYPHIAVIDPRTGERMAVWENLGMKPAANQFAELATLFLSEHPGLNNSFTDQYDEPKEDKKSSSVIDLSESKQLEAAIQASLIAKRANMTSPNINKGEVLVSDTDDDVDSEDHQQESSQENEEDANLEEPVSKRRKTDENENVEEKENVTSIKSLLLEKSQMKSLPKTDKVIIEEAKIMLRLPDGGRKQLRLCLTNTLKELTDEISKLGYPKSNYELIKSFPRENISELDQTISLKQAGLHKQETLFVQDR